MVRQAENVEIIEAGEADQDFLYAVYASTRAYEVNTFGWDAARADAFLKMQFTMRTRSYAMQMPDVATYVVRVDGEAAGCTIVNRSENEISLIDIAVLPAFRGKGIASSVIRKLQNESAASRKPVSLSVEKNNPNAYRLYLSLSFVVVGETDLSYAMQWTT